MNLDVLKSDWAAWIALPLLVVVMLVVVRALYRRSARGQLSRALKKNGAAETDLRNAARAVARAEARLEKLQQRSEKVKPRVLEEARGAVDDSRALLKILDDKRQVTMNHLRRVIFEEFPPSRHQRMRARYLPQDVEDGRPFSF